MDTNGVLDNVIVKQKVISSSKLKSINLKQSFVKDSPADLTSVENQIAAISFSQKSFNNTATNAKFQRRLDLNLTNNSFNANAKMNGVKSPQHRFNPFDQLDESNRSSSSNDSKSCETSNSPSSGLAELGLTEDHFSGSMGLSSAEELKIAIENCRELILNYPDGSKKKDKLMKNLVQLQIKLQDIKDNSMTSISNVKKILGHQLKKKKNRSLKSICDCCRSSMWGLMPVWYECSECSFICHEKCIDHIRRSCVAGIAKSSSYDLNICPESGLSKQMYCCKECKDPITVGTGVDKGRLCDYTGSYYCSNCHWDDSLVVPARVVHNWDHTPQKVCRQSFQLLNKMYRLPVLNIEKINPMLFNYVEELSEIKRMRENILKMKEYLRTCTTARETKLLQMLSNRQHFIENSFMYSMEDLVQTNSGQLTDELVKMHGIFAKHIKLDCMACQGKGFICEICNAGEALFPFDYMVAICPKCSAVFHSDCFSFIDKTCPRCRRKQEKRNLSLSFIIGSETLSSSEDEDKVNDSYRFASSYPATYPFGESKTGTTTPAFPSAQSTYPRDEPHSALFASNQNESRVKATSSSLSLRRDKQAEEKLIYDRSDAPDHDTDHSKNPFLIDKIDSPDNPFLIDKIDSPDNPFLIDEVDSSDNPFLNDVYDQSKNPFCR